MKTRHPNNSEKANRKVRLVRGKQSILTPRLMAAASLVRMGASVADIGTDHAYLPIYLVQNGVTPRAIACDINKGPLARAEENVNAADLCDQIELMRTDGLHGVETFAPDDILICGMGGELIIQILSESAFIREGDRHLILQPMTSAEKLRKWLCAVGFEIVKETLAAEEERIYELICARYTAQKIELSEAQAIAGFAEHNELYRRSLCQKLARLQKQIDGRLVSGRDASELLKLKAQLESLREPSEP